MWLRAALLLLLCALGLGIWLAATGGKDNTSAPATSGVTYEDYRQAPSLQEMHGKQSHARIPAKGIAIIMDDIGYDLKQVRRVLALPFPIALSILPDAPHAKKAAKLANSHGNIVMLHLPMEAMSQIEKGKIGNDFLRADMSRPEARQRMLSALELVPHVVGINNHMGSLLTSMVGPMRWVMEICRQQGLFFVDSRTSKETVAAGQARLAGIRWGERRVFLDHNPDMESLKSAWKLAKRYLARDGYCIVILHPHAETLDFLEHQISEFDKRQIVPVTDLLHQGKET